MARRRLLKSYFYVEYDGQKYLNGGTITVPPFEATGGTGSFTINSTRPWEINNKPAWLTLSSVEGDRGSTQINFTADTNSGSAQRTGEMHIGLKNFLTTRNIDIDLTQRAVGSTYIDVIFPASTVGASVTSNTFTLNCVNINLSTVGYYASESSGVVSCDMATSSVTIGENTGYTDRNITLAISGESTVGNFVSGSAQFTQTKKIVTPSLTITYTGDTVSAAAGSTNAFTVSGSYITEVTRYSVSPNTATITSTGQTGLTVQYPANTGSSKQYTVSVSGTDVYGVTKTGSTTFTQNADSYTLTITPPSYSASATDTLYSGFTISSSNVSSTGLSRSGIITAATRSGNNVVTEFEQNQTSSVRTGSVTITGKTVGGQTVSATGSLSQAVAAAANLSIQYTGATLTPQSGTTSAFTVTAQNATVTSYTVDNNASATMLSSGVMISYPNNTNEDSGVTYTVTVWGKNEVNQTVSASCQVAQSADTYSLSISPSSYTALAIDTSYSGFTVASTNVSTTGLSYSGAITGATRVGDNITVNFTQNQTSSSRTGSVTISGKTLGGRTVSTSANLTQNAAGQTSLSIDYTGGTITSQAGSTSAFTVQVQNITITSYTVDHNATATTLASGVMIDYPNNTDESNTIVYTVTVWGKNEFDQTVSASTTFTQAADTYTLVINPASYIAAATDTSYSGFMVTSSNVTSTGLTYDGTVITAATRNGNNITVQFAQNQTDSARTGSVTISGKTLAGRTVSATASLSQNAAGQVSLTISYTGGTITSQAGSTSAFTVTAQNVTVTSYTVDNNASATTLSPGVMISYPNNTNENSGVTYTVTVWGKDEFDRTVSATTTFVQAADTYSLTITPASYTALATDISYSGFTVSSGNVTSTGLTYDGIVITAATMAGNNITVKFEQNQTDSARTGSVTITGKTLGGRTVNASASLSQFVAVGSLSITYDGVDLGPLSGSTSAFTVSTQNATITGYSVDHNATATSLSPGVMIDYPSNTDPNSSVTYTVTVWGKNEVNQTISASCQVEQEADSYEFYVIPSAETVDWASMQTNFTTSASNVSDIGYYSAASENINSCRVSGNIYTALFSMNTGNDPKTIKFVASGKTRVGEIVYASATTTQDSRTGTPTLAVGREPSGTSSMYVAAQAGTSNFTVSWRNLKEGESITFSGGNLTSYSPSSIAITSANKSSGSSTIVATYGENQENTMRDLVLSAHSVGQGGQELNRSAYYTQASYHSGSISVTPKDEQIGSGATSITFNVAWTDLRKNAILSFSVSSAMTKPANIDIGSTTTSNTALTVNISANTDNGTRRLYFDVHGFSDNRLSSVTDSAYCYQAGQTPGGTIKITPRGGSSGQVGSGETSITFNVEWTNLKSATWLEFGVSDAITSSTPSKIYITTTNTSSSNTITVGISQNPNGTTRNATLTASGTGQDSQPVASSGWYVQAGAPGAGSITVTPDGDQIGFAQTSVTYTVTWSNLPTNTPITLTGSSALTSYPASINVGNKTSGSSAITATVLQNPNSSTRNATLTASATDARPQTVSDSGFYEQAGSPAPGRMLVTPNESEVSFAATSTTFTVSWSGLSANTQITLTTSGAATACTPTSISITNKTTSSSTVTVRQTTNSGTTARNLVLNASGTDNFSSTIAASGSVMQAGKTDDATITVTPNGSQQIGSGATSVTYTVTWTNLKTGSTITITGSDGLSNISPSTISVGSNTSSSTGVTANVLANPSTAASRNVILSATGFDSLDVSVSGSGYFTQARKARNGSVSVSPSGTSMTSGSSNVTFTVGWSNLIPNTQIVLSGSSAITSLSPSAISIGNMTSSSTGVTANVSANPSSAATRNVILKASGTDETSATVTGSGYYVQNAAAPAVFYTATIGWKNASGARQGGTIQYSLNGGNYVTASLTPTFTVGNLSSGDIIEYTLIPISSSNFLKYKGTITIASSNVTEDGVAVENAFVVTIKPYDTSDTRTNGFRLNYSSRNGASGYIVFNCSGTGVTQTISLDSNYVTDNDDRFSYTVEKQFGSITVSGWDVTGSKGTATDITTNTLNTSFLKNIYITSGQAENIALSYRGVYIYSGTLNWNASSASNWSSCEIKLSSSTESYQQALLTSQSSDTGAFTAITSGQQFTLAIGGGLGDGQKYKNYTMRVEAANHATLYYGNCAGLYATDSAYSGTTVTAAQLNGSTWYLTGPIN